MSAARKVIYWQDVVGDEAIINEYREDIARLLAGEYTACGIEKLNDYNVYSMRLNKKGRLLFTTIVDDGISYVVILEVLLNHEYDSSRFLKHGVLQRYLQKNIDKLKEQAATSQENWSSVTDDDAEKLLQSIKKEDGNIEFVAKKYYQHRFIQLNLEQEQAIIAKLPLIISGCAGAGKTCVALTILTQMLQQLESEGELLYVAQQPELVERMQRTWSQMTALDPSKSQRVQFKTYEQLILEQNPSLKDFTRVGEDEFIDTIKKRIALYKKLSTTSEEDKIAIAAIEKRLAEVYQEARIMSAYSLEEYCELGRNSLFTDSNQRKWLYAAFDFYQKGLAANKKYDLSLQKFNLDKKYKFIVTDEAQDLSTRQLKTLHESAEECCFCMDSHQSLEDAQSKRPHLFRILKNPAHIELPYSERCLPAIARVANVIIDIKNSATGGKADKLEYCKMETRTDGKQGDVEWIENITPEDIERLKKQSKKSDRAVIIPDESLQAEAEKIYNTSLVFTVEQIKGSEYDTVIVHGMIGDEFKEANLAISQDGLKQNSNRAKDGKSHADLAPPFNRLYTAFTRAKRALIVVQPIAHNNKLICTYLRDAITPVKEEKEHIIETPITTKEDWFERAKILFLEGKKDHAKRILMTELEYSEKDYINFALQLEEPEKKDVRRTPDLDTGKTIQKVTKQPHASISASSPSLVSSLGPATKGKKFSITLPKKLTPKNLATFFKSPEAIDFLFTRDDKNTFPFMRFCSQKSSDSAVLLGFFHKNPTIAKKIPVHYLYQSITQSSEDSFLGELGCGTQDGIGILGHILLDRDDVDIAELCTKLTKKSISRRYTDKLSRFSPLLGLCSRKVGVGLLKHIADRSSSFMDHLKLEESCYEYQSLTDDYDVAIFGALCLMDIGLEFMNRYFEHKTERYQSIPPTMLFSLIERYKDDLSPFDSMASRNKSNFSSFDSMIESLAGLTFLNNIATHNPKLFDHLNISNVLANIISKEDEFVTVPVYLILLATSNQVFTLLGRYYDEFAKDFVSRLVLAKDLSKTQHEYSPYRIIMKLIYDREYFIMNILREKNDLFELLHQNDLLCRPFNGHTISPITILFMCEDFYPYVLSLFEKSTEILVQIPYHELISDNIYAEDGPQGSPLLSLSMHEDGRFIIKKMLVHSSELRKTLSSSDVLANLTSLSRADGAIQTVSIYEVLKETPSGQAIMDMLKELNPALTDEEMQLKLAENMQKLVKKQIMRATEAVSVSEAVSASLALVTQGPSSKRKFTITLPKKLTVKNLTDFFKSPEAIDFIFTKVNDKFPFLEMIKNTNDASNLLIVLRKNIEIAKKIPIHYLYQLNTQGQSIDPFPILGVLACDAEKAGILDCILLNQDEVDVTELCVQLTKKFDIRLKGGAIMVTSALAEFSAKSLGAELILKFCKKLPSFMQHLKFEELFFQYGSGLNRATIYYFLCFHDQGLEFLSNYFEQDPAYYKRLTSDLLLKPINGKNPSLAAILMTPKHDSIFLQKLIEQNPSIFECDIKFFLQLCSFETLRVPLYYLMLVYNLPAFNLLAKHHDFFAKDFVIYAKSNLYSDHFDELLDVIMRLILENQYFLVNLIREKSDFLDWVHAKYQLYRPFETYNVCPITILLASDYFYPHALFFLERHPSILSRFEFRELAGMVYLNNQLQTPPLYKLASHEEGRILLKKMLANNKEAGRIFASLDVLTSLYKFYIIKSQEVRDISIYERLKESPTTGHEILGHLKKLNPDLTDEAIERELARRLEAEKKQATPNPAAFFSLPSSESVEKKEPASPRI